MHVPSVAAFLFRPALPINLGNFDHATGGIASNGSLSPWGNIRFLALVFHPTAVSFPRGSISTRDFRNLSAQIVNNVVCFFCVFVCLDRLTRWLAGSLAHPSCHGAATGVSTTAGAGEWDGE